MSKRVYNWQRDIPDFRDFHYESLTLSVSGGHPLPKKVDLRAQCSPVVNQGDIGSCTGNSLAGHIEFLELKEIKANLPLDQAPEEFERNKFASVSRLFIYYNERVIENTVNEDAGAQIRDGIKALASVGFCREAVWEYHENLVFQKPTDVAFAEASKHKISKYMRLTTLNGLKHCLANGYPFAFGFAVYESFESDQVAQDGLVPFPGPEESMIGGHAVLAVGYDDEKEVHGEKGCFIVRNSWGPDWGDKGYFYLPYSFFIRHLCDDYWSIRL